MAEFSSEQLIALEAIKLHSGPATARKIEGEISNRDTHGELFGDDSLAVVALGEALRSQAERFRLSASSALHTLAIRDATPVSKRLQALRTLQKANDPLAEDALHALLLDKRHEARYGAAKASPAIPSTMTIDLLGAQLADEFHDVAAASCEALRRIGKPAVYALIGALGFDSPGARILAAEELGWMGERQAVPALIDGLRKHSNAEQCIYMHVLGVLDDPRAVPALVDKLSSPQEEIQIHAARALSKFKSYDAWAGLRRTIECEPPPPVEDAAKSSMKSIEQAVGFFERLKFMFRFCLRGERPRLES